MTTHQLPATAFPCIVHPFNSETSGTCAYESGNPSSKNALVVIGGLGDGPHTLSLVRGLRKRLEHDSSALDYSVFEVRLRSSFSGWGLCNLANDVSDLRSLVQYLRGIGKERIVFFGHSTGCQVGLGQGRRQGRLRATDTTRIA
jgi:pimeloyl-ACP methyl ester carboxylesterase